MRVLIAGCGYVGLHLGARLVDDGHVVGGIRRPGSDPSPLRECGIEPFAADLTQRADLDAISPGWDAVVDCVAPAEGGEAAYRAVYFEGARNLVDRFRATPPRAFVFTSSTSVYPQDDGSDVDESSATDGASPTSRILLETENLLLDAAQSGFPAILLRVAGIYGPGRNRIAAMNRGDARMTGDGTRWMNMIHRDDLVDAIITVLAKGKPVRLYTVSDSAACTEREFYAWLSVRLGRPLPPVADAAEVTRRGRFATNKRVVADRLRNELGWTPRHSDFRSGYEQELAALGL